MKTQTLGGGPCRTGATKLGGGVCRAEPRTRADAGVSEDGV